MTTQEQNLIVDRIRQAFCEHEYEQDEYHMPYCTDCGYQPDSFELHWNWEANRSYKED